MNNLILLIIVRKLKVSIPFLSSQLNTTEKDFYDCYLNVKNSFAKLTDDVILVKKMIKIIQNCSLIPRMCHRFCFLKEMFIYLMKNQCVLLVTEMHQLNHEKTERIVKSLIKRNIVVNAGLARGIDTAIHESALKNGGRTISVIGTPINQYYPKENKELQKEIEEKGLVVSQFPPCNSVNRWNFPICNATMSGISLATIIMEAGETKAGRLCIKART